MTTAYALPKNNPVRFTLKEHQTFASEMMENVDCLALFYEAGTGKTMCALDWAYRAVERGELNSLLVICPANIVGVWASAIDGMIRFEGYTEDGIARLKSIVTIRSFQKTYVTETHEVHHRNGGKGTKKTRKIRPDIDRYWGAIVVDESHSIGSHSSIQTKAALSLSLKASKRFILTGTPVSGGGGAGDYKKLYGQLKFLDNAVWASWADFCRRYVLAYDVFHNPVKYREPELRKLMEDYGIVARLDMCYDMPESSEIVIPCELKEAQAYRRIREGDTASYGFEIRTGGGQYIKLLELVSGHVKTDENAQGVKDTIRFKCDKPDALRTIVSGTDDKVVVFCKFRESIDDAYEVCAKFGETVIFDGRSHKDTWRDFQYGDARYLICQYQSGGVGLDLYASHTMVFYEPEWSSLLLEQAKARIRRKGQTQHCIYYWLSTKGTIEEDAISSVRNGVSVTTDLLEMWAKREMGTRTRTDDEEDEEDAEDEDDNPEPGEAEI